MCEKNAKKEIIAEIEGLDFERFFVLTHEELKMQLKLRCDKSSQRKVARELNVTATCINDILRGNRKIGKQLAKKLGYFRKEVITRTLEYVKEI
jgi:biotin operon repressor